MIIVTGATGQLGGLIVERLLDLVPAERIGVSVRDPIKVGNLARHGVRVRRGDFAEPESLRYAFEGAEQILIVSSNARVYGGDPLSQHRAAIEAAIAVGTRRIVYTSHMGASFTSAFPPMHDHAATEDMLRNCGVAWTALRNGFYAESIRSYLGDVASSGALDLPADGKVAWTAHADLAAAAARLLVDTGKPDGPTPPLTAGKALDFGDVAEILEDLVGHPITRRVIPDDTMEAHLAAQGMTSHVIAITIGFYRAARAGEFADAGPALTDLLGNEPTDLRKVLADMM